mgnify:FL=1|tara:strand:+ start:251 stop:1033 length:783 start_codon:yes stop_codon:yes gene_type:complete
MYTHNLNPILFDLGFLSIRWYSLAYIFGILIGWWLGKKIIVSKASSDKNILIEEFDNLITYLIIGIIVGGRIGYVIFYNLNFYFQNPLSVLKIWEGGMSFHGALIGVIIATYYFSISKGRRLDALFFLDILACVTPVGLFFGRIANFINGELVGKVTNVSWAVIFPTIDTLPRHPSQLYEAFLEGLILFIIMISFIFKKNYKIGTCSLLFLILYGVFRIFCELFREPDVQIGYLFNLTSMGTLLSAIMILSGLFIFIKKR